MVKSYLRYEQSAVFGLVAHSASSSSVVYAKKGRWAIAAALEAVIVWDIRKGSQVMVFRDGVSEVTALALGPDGRFVAVGYADGTIRLWSLESGLTTMVLHGHSAAVSCFCFDTSAALLASGSADSDIVVWDVLAETGLYRLRGHKDMVTALRFLDRSQRLVSASKDTLVKIWDLPSQSCTQTIVGHRAEVWALAVNADESRLVTGSVDAALRVWDLSPLFAGVEQRLDAPGADSSAINNGGGGGGMVESIDVSDPLAPAAADRFAAVAMGHIAREGSDRVCNLQYSADGAFLLCQGAERVLQLFRVRPAEEVAKRLKRRLKRRREKAAAAAVAAAAAGTGAAAMAADDDDDDAGAGDGLQPGDELAPALLVRTKDRARSAVLSPGKELSILVALASNVLEEYRIEVRRDADGAVTELAQTKTAVLEREGHRADVRCIALASTDDLALSGTNGAAKLWSLRSGQAVRTLDCGYALCVAFAPGDRHALVGTKAGTIEVFDLRTGEAGERLQAHVGEVWGLRIAPDGATAVSVSADKEARFWELSHESGGLTLIHTRTLKMAEDILSVAYSPDGKFVAMALLDATVKVFFVDSLRFFVSLYGHKLPVLALAFSSDCSLIATGSADKNLKLWGADFGDCHKSLFAHDDSLMALAWVRNTHYLFTAGKDGKVNYWDCDSYELIQSLPGHAGEIWALALSSLGDFAVTGSHDRSVRVWRRSEEQLFIEEEAEARRERGMADEVAAESRRRPAGDGDVDAVSGSTAVRSLETMKAGERVLEAIGLAVGEEASRVGDDYDPSPMLLGLTPSKFLLKTLREVRASELDEALMVLPFTAVYHLLEHAAGWVRDGSELDLELAARTVGFLVRTHLAQLAANQGLRVVVAELQAGLRKRLDAAADVIGFNMAATAHVAAEAVAAKSVNFFGEAAAVSQFAEVQRLV